ncbi:winged helix-turn-helix domain-containing protein [Streptomyces sp. CRN 30]|uniref:winged helix-turn-helix domain-containing protein n=1 Tax=Streptomyces sp. CRN 30 TaxID=3075613 RepID=UPI002A80884A|nr:winged helix-turn-helix domain-containing protein [Streptomyces sp. CRN 30]
MGGRNGGDSGGKEFARVADELRSRMTDGTYPYGSTLPAQRDMAEEFRVSRDTVQRVLRELVSERWIETRRGSGSRVVHQQRIDSRAGGGQASRVVTLDSLMSEAFTQPEVTLDAYTLTSESLDVHLRIQMARIEAGYAAPRSLRVRLLLPDEDLPSSYWRSADPSEDRALRERIQNITHRHTASLRETLDRLRRDGLVPSVECEIKHLAHVPTEKLYLLNGASLLRGWYMRYRRVIEVDDGRRIATTDVRGLSAGLTHYVKGDPSSPDTLVVTEAQEWFDDVWQDDRT